MAASWASPSSSWWDELSITDLHQIIWVFQVFLNEENEERIFCKHFRMQSISIWETNTSIIYYLPFIQVVFLCCFIHSSVVLQLGFSSPVDVHLLLSTMCWGCSHFGSALRSYIAQNMLPVTFTDTYGKHEPLFSWIECWTANLNAHESDYWNVGRCIHRWEHSSVAVFSVLVKIIIGQTEISVFISCSWQESKWVFFFQPQIVLLIIMDHDKP